MDYPIELSARATSRPLAQPLQSELANSITHGLGVVLSLVGAGWLLIAANEQGQFWLLAGCSIYAICQIAVYSASTLSHAIQEPRRKDWLRSIDQASIYLMAGGSFTPFALAYTCNDGWWVCLAVMWAAALIGFATKVLWKHRVNRVSIPLYIIVGWMPILAAKPAYDNAPSGALMWALAGGCCYTIGTWFLARDHKHIAFHPIWHLLVIAGSSCHFWVMFHYVVNNGAIA